MKSQTYMVGGAVRDMLMGVEPKDVDWVVVGSTPEEMLADGFKQVGADFPVFIHPDSGEEYALARTEVKDGVGYNGFKVHFDPTVTINEDLMRRDLTINSIAHSPETGFIDPFNGMDDIERKILRATSSAFKDDPVRALRLFRLHARYGREWRIADSTWDLVFDMDSDGEFANLTAERVWKEMEKALHEPYTEIFFESMAMVPGLWAYMKGLGVISFMFPVNATAKQKYAFVAWYAKDDMFEKFEKDLRVPKEYSTYAKMYNSIRSGRLNNFHPVVILNDASAYRNPTLFKEVAKDEGVRWEVLTKAFDITHSVGFDALLPHQKESEQVGLRGHWILWARKRAYEAHMAAEKMKA